MSELPAATAVTTPVELLIVATLSSALDHVPPESPSVSKSDVASEHKASVPLSVPALGAVVTVAVLVAVASEHPPVPVAATVADVAAVAEHVTLPLGEPEAVEANLTYTAEDAKVPSVGE